MICLICRRSEIANGLTSVHFERGEMSLVIHLVPALVCPVCSEAYVEEEVTLRLLQMAGEISETGVLKRVTEYNIPG